MIDFKEFTKRRQFLLENIGPDAVAILFAATECRRNNDAVYPFRQDSDFYYMTGFNEPEAVAVFVSSNKGGEYLLFCRSKNPEEERWTGPRVGQEQACSIYGADQAFPIERLDEKMREILINKKTIYYPLGTQSLWDHKVQSWLSAVSSEHRRGLTAPNGLFKIQNILHEMRLYKTAGEIDCIRHAVKISTSAHIRAMSRCLPGMKEYELEAELIYEFIRNGSRASAYTPIVAAGPNAAILHYTDNNAVLKSGELVLIDAGAEYLNYASDITRTFPANGRFNVDQAAIYELVLAAQTAAIEKIRPGVPWNKLQDTAIEVISQGLIDLGLLRGDLKSTLETKAYRAFYMHNIGHWLGLDVHDVGAYKVDDEWRPLEEGMVLTVEPGIYISPDKSIPEKWWNIGIRIEDDVLVTDNGVEVLSKEIPKTIQDIELLMS